MFCVIFLALTMVIIGTMPELILANNKNSHPDTSTGWSIVGGRQYKMWSTEKIITSSDNYTVDGVNTTEYGQWYSAGLGDSWTLMGTIDSTLNSMAHFDFYDPDATPIGSGHHRLDVWIVRNNTGYVNHRDMLYSTDTLQVGRATRDFLFFREYGYSGALIGGHSNYYDVTGYTQLQYGENYSYAVTQSVGKYNITVFLFPMVGETNITDGLQSNHFRLAVGGDIFNINIGGKIGMVNIISALFTFRCSDIGIPNPMGYLISVPIWIATIFAVIGIISRFFPTIPGF